MGETQVRRLRRRLQPPGGRDSWGDWFEARLPSPLHGIVARMRRDQVLINSSSLAFYALVSAAPLAVLIMWVASLAIGEQRVQQAGHELQALAPANLDIGSLFEQVAKVGSSVGVIAILSALWPASAYGSGLRRALNELAPEPDEEFEGLRGRGLLILFVLPLAVFGGVLVSLIGTQIAGASPAGRAAGILVALAAAFLVAAVTIAVIYRVFPRIRLSWSSILKGTLTAAASVSVLSLAFSVYLSYGADFRARYASSTAAAVVLFGVWLFLSNALLLVGFKMALETD